MPPSPLGAEGTGARPPRRPKLLLVLVASAVLATALIGAVSLASGAEPSVTPPTASTVRYTTATGKGEVDPRDHETSYHFEYATRADFSDGQSAGFGSLAEGAGLTSVEAELTGLKPGTTYHLRLIAENVEGQRKEVEAATTFTTEVVAAPSVSLEPVTTVGATNVQFVGHVNPNAPNAQGSTDAAEAAAFRTEYRFVCSPACPGLTGATGTTEADDTAHEVVAESTGLPPGSRSYEVKLVASNLGGETVAGPIPFSTSSAAPTIESTSASPGVREIEFRAAINPGNLATTYRFEYGPTAAYTRSTETRTIAPSASPVAVTAKVSGLEPSSAYHFRVIAQNAKGPAMSVDQEIGTTSAAAVGPCPNEQLRSEDNSLGLPDCRAYEMVSPPFKNGQPPISPKGIAADGSAIAYNSLGAFGEPGNNTEQLGGAYVADRAGSGWSSVAVNPSATEFQGGNPNLQTGEAAETVDYAASLDASLFLQAPVGAKPIDSRFYTRMVDGTVTEVGPLIPPATIAEWTPADAEAQDIPTPGYRGASGDLTHLFFDEGSRTSPGGKQWLWPGDTTASIGTRSLYEYSGIDNREPELVAIENNTSLAQAASEQSKAHINEAAELISQCGSGLGGVTYEGHVFSAANAISESGLTVFFTAFGHEVLGCAAGLHAPEKNELFARIDRKRTVAISEPTNGPTGDCAACNLGEPEEALFQGASRDGRRVFFISEQTLLPGASGINLYEYDFDAPTHQKVTLIAPRLPAGNASVPLAGVARISPNGVHAYFVSTAADIASNALSSQGTAPVEGADNLYTYGPNPSSGASEVVYIGTLSAEDEADWRVADARPVRTTGDGRFLLLPSVSNLTNEPRTGPSRQLFRYEAPSSAHPVGHLIRISVGENGFNEDGNAAAAPGTLYSPEYNDGLFELSSEASQSAAPKPVLISENGSKVFFESPLALTPGALDDACAYENSFGECEAAAQNIYEWEAGHVYLISDGRDAHSRFRFSATSLIGATPSGEDVFFSTADPLVSQDTDTQVDFYDARVDGGFPAANPAPSCHGETCQGPLAESPATTSVASAGVVGTSKLKPTHKRKKKHKKHHKKRSKHHRKHAHFGQSGKGGQQ
jgi:hypothetical protein